VGVDEHKGIILLVRARTGEILDSRNLGTSVYSIFVVANEGRRPGLVLLTRAIPDGPYSLLFVDSGERGFAGVKSQVIERSLKDPGIYPVFNTGEHSVAIWDRASDKELVFLFSSAEQVWRVFPLRLLPYELAAVGRADLLLGVHSRENAVSLVNTQRGVIDDKIVVEGISSAEGQVTIFTPAARYGGTGDVLVANSRSETLTVLSLSESKLLSRLRPPTQITLKNIGLPRATQRQLLLAADVDLSVILVGAAGSDKVGMFRKVGGGLQEIQTISRDMPIRDMAVLEGPQSGGSELFIFLHRNGHDVTVESELASRVQVPGEVSAVASGSESRLDPRDITRLQRVLATLGYQIGAIDGVSGPLTTAAIRSFQFANSLTVTGIIDDKTRAALDESIAKHSRRSQSDASYLEEYSAFVGIAKEKARQLLTLGAANEDPNHPCFGLNSLPPKVLWSQSAELARVLQRLEDHFRLSVEVVSGYRTPAYNRCIAGPAGSTHLQFRGFDLRLADVKAEGTILLEALNKLRAEGAISYAGPIAGGSARRIFHVHTGSADTEANVPPD
jgi:hypothetical protein